MFLMGIIFGALMLAAIGISFLAGRQVERNGWKSLLEWRDWRKAVEDCSKIVASK